MKDTEFIRGDVPMTKEEVRAIAISKLNLHKAKGFLDVGAGTGSVALEAKCLFPHLEVVAIERHPHAVALIKQNSYHLSAPITIILGTAPLEMTKGDVDERVKEINVKVTRGARPPESFDAIFVGGTGGNVEKLIPWIETIAAEGAQVVMTFVTLEQFTQTLTALKARYKAVEVTQITISKSEPLGPFTYLKPNNPTFLIHYCI